MIADHDPSKECVQGRHHVVGLFLEACRSVEFDRCKDNRFALGYRDTKGYLGEPAPNPLYSI